MFSGLANVLVLFWSSTSELSSCPWVSPGPCGFRVWNSPCLSQSWTSSSYLMFFLPRDAELREPVPLEHWKTKQKLFNCENIFVEPFKKKKGSGLSHLWQRSSNVSLNPKQIVKKLQWWKSVTGMSGSMNRRGSCLHLTWTLWPLTDHYYWKISDSSASQQTLTRLA